MEYRLHQVNVVHPVVEVVAHQEVAGNGEVAEGREGPHVQYGEDGLLCTL